MSCTLWGTTIPGWATDYVILLVCIVCCVVAAMQRRSGSGLFFLLMISTGLGFGVGGVSHMLLFFVEKEGEFCGSTWSEENNEWMYAWLVALLVTPFSPAALASMAVKNAQYRWSWMVILTLFLLALILAVVEAALFLALELELSGMMTGFWIMISSAFTVLVLLVDVWQNGFRWQIAYGVVSAGMYINGSLTLLLLSGVLPVAFNANALFHVFVILMVIFAFLYRSEPSTAKFQLAATPKSTQETPTAEAKVTEEI